MNNEKNSMTDEILKFKIEPIATNILYLKNGDRFESSNFCSVVDYIFNDKPISLQIKIDTLEDLLHSGICHLYTAQISLVNKTLHSMCILLNELKELKELRKLKEPGVNQ